MLKFQEDSFCSGNYFGISLDYLKVKCADFFRGITLITYFKTKLTVNVRSKRSIDTNSIATKLILLFLLFS